MRSRLAAAVSVLAGMLLLAGCSATVHMEPADDANNPLCAAVSVALPDGVGEEGSTWQERRWTDAQATAAWGADAAVLLRCGVTVPGPTSELQCVTFDGVDWLVDDSETPNLRITSYGRDPAVQLYIKTDVISADDVLPDVASAVKKIPATSACVAPDVQPDDVDELAP